MSSSVTLRFATDADHEACAQIFSRSFRALHREQGFTDHADPADELSFMREAMAHFGATDPELQWVADEGGEVVGFSSAWRRERQWFLGFLFIDPEAQGRGIGRSLLEKVLPPENERPDLVMSTVVESTQPVSQGLYASYGMVPRTPMPLMIGRPRGDELPDTLPRGVEAEPIDEVDPDEIAAFERINLGYSRGPHHTWIATEDAAGFAYRRRGRLAAYGYRSPVPWWGGTMISPIVTDAADLPPSIITHLVGQGDGDVLFRIYGGASTLMPTLLRSGFRIMEMLREENFPFIFCSSGAVPDPDRILPYSGFLP